MKCDSKLIFGFIVVFLLALWALQEELRQSNHRQDLEIHDLQLRTMLIQQGKKTPVIDFGDIQSGDYILYFANRWNKSAVIGKADMKNCVIVCNIPQTIMDTWDCPDGIKNITIQ